MEDNNLRNQLILVLVISNFLGQKLPKDQKRFRKKHLSGSKIPFYNLGKLHFSAPKIALGKCVTSQTWDYPRISLFSGAKSCQNHPGKSNFLGPKIKDNNLGNQLISVLVISNFPGQKLILQDSEKNIFRARKSHFTTLNNHNFQPLK